nr:Putative cytoplasmic protein [Kibdelosporangium sp. MJ126-NF4]CTQ98569.1 Putative cytoplasmic protein [Kibdelosporangium sp. MJ126-NF4]
MNANGKLLDVWMLICCELCGRTSKIPVHERVHVQALEHERLVMFEHNDPAMVRLLTMDTALAGRAGYRLDWNGTWTLDTDMPFHYLAREESALEVIIRFELPAPIRVEKLLTSGFGLSRSAVRGMVDSGRIRLPMALDAKAREDFTLFVTTVPHDCSGVSPVQPHAPNGLERTGPWHTRPWGGGTHPVHDPIPGGQFPHDLTNDGVARGGREVPNHLAGGKGALHADATPMCPRSRGRHYSTDQPRTKSDRHPTA